MIGILAEKLSAARNFEKALGGRSGVFNGEQYIIAHSAGHLYALINPEEQVPEEMYNTYKKWKLETLPWDETQFQWKKARLKGSTTLLNNIKESFKDCDEIVIATDNDPSKEGELLAWEILSTLKLHPKKWSRMYFDDESVKSVQQAFINRKPIKSMKEDADYIQADYRSKWDFLSMQFTRIMTLLAGGNSTIRTGRLKGAMTVIIGDALKALAEYKKVPFYQNRFKDENGNIYTNSNEPLFKTPGEVPKTYTSSDVVVDSKEIKKSVPPKLIDIASLSASLASKGISSKVVTDTYQAMYDNQVVSYPRTEDKCITIEQYNELYPFIDILADLVGVDKRLLTHRSPRPTHIKNGMAHGANRPGPNIPKSLEELNRKYGACASDIYVILTRSYLAMFGEDYEYEHQEGHIKAYPDFKGSTNIPKKMGFKLILGANEDNVNDEGKELGKKGEPFVYEGYPPKPPVPTMKWLMNQLSKYDIGTASTQVGTFTEITKAGDDRSLIAIDKKGKLSLTQTGEIAYQLLPGTNIGSIKRTEELHQEMKDVANGKLRPEEGLSRIKGMVLEDIETMKNNVKHIEHKDTAKQVANSNDVLGKCPKCGSNVMSGKYGAYCTGKCGVTLSKAMGKQLTDNEIKNLLLGKKTLVHGLSGKKGKFNAYLTVHGLKEYSYKSSDGEIVKGTGLDFTMEFER